MRATIDVVRRAYELHEDQVSYRKIAKELGVGASRVGEWIKDPSTHSPFIDEIAIERALEGDRSVYNNLSRFERVEFFGRVHRRGMSDDASGELASRLGVDVKQFRDNVNATVRRHRL